jgi:hypothetical protein
LYNIRNSFGHSIDRAVALDVLRGTERLSLSIGAARAQARGVIE